MADIDNDGDMDLLFGDDYGNVRLYLRDDEGELSFEGNLEADGEELDVVERAAPDWIDWDLDSDFDLLVGSSEGTVSLFINEGNAEEADFTFAGTLEAGGEEIWLGSETAPAMGDLDRDGKRDLILGSVFGEIWFYPNTGEDDDPEFGEGIALKDEEGGINLDMYTRVEVVDWDGDGYLDMVSGLYFAEIRLFINPGDSKVPLKQDFSAAEFHILTNYPEPFNSRTNLLIRCSGYEDIRLDIRDVSGRLVKTMNPGLTEPGIFTYNIDLSGFPCGRYIADLRAGDRSEVTIITLLK